MQGDVDVAIVGLGPVGAVLANLLAAHGLTVVVFERAAQIYDLPRAVHFDDDAMRVFQTIGIAAKVDAVTRVNAGMRFFDTNGRMLLDWPRPQEVGPQGWYPSYRFHQPDLERILRERLSGRSRVDLHLSHDVTEITQSGTEARVRWQSMDGEMGTTTASFVVGCDGGRSIVRSTIGGGSEDLGFHERWLVVDVLLQQDVPGLGDFTIQHCDPAGPATYVRGPGQRRRWEIYLGGSGTETSLPHAEVWQHLSRWLTPDQAEIERAAIYTFHSVLANRWRAGRLLLAGDAAHQMPPFLGQGLCAGIRDASNLAWKLAAICRGEDAADALLDTYQSERRPNVRAYIEKAIDLGNLINASDSEAALSGAFLNPDGTRKMASIAPRLGPGIATSTPKSDLDGLSAPQPLLTDGQLMDVAIGTGWALLTRSRPDDLPDLPGGLSVLSDDDPGIAACLDGLDVYAVLVRPDRVVAGIARDAARVADLCTLDIDVRSGHGSALGN